VLPLTKRQREILDYLNEFIEQHGYAPSLEEIGRRFSLSSLATVHKHLTNLQEKVPESMAGKRDSYVLRVKGDSMIDEQIRDGDWVVVEDRKSADNGEMVIALVDGTDVTLKKFYRDNGRIRLQPANPTMRPMMFDADQVQVQGVVVGVMRKY
jgi:repressor LexA